MLRADILPDLQRALADRHGGRRHVDRAVGSCGRPDGGGRLPVGVGTQGATHERRVEDEFPEAPVRGERGALGLRGAQERRLLLRSRDAGMLAVRHKLLDALVLVVLGGSLIFLAGSIPEQPGF